MSEMENKGTFTDLFNSFDRNRKVSARISTEPDGTHNSATPLHQPEHTFHGASLTGGNCCGRARNREHKSEADLTE